MLNGWDIFIIAAVAAAVFFAVRTIYKNRGSCGCSPGCAGCAKKCAKARGRAEVDKSEPKAYDLSK
ncbi:MAG: FeoB-associated Cys-rich membrane protein [Clostridia bacterium]|nr:FeoB-associated Cys-rich membrane protein [Clostridia bacterium]